MSRSGLGRRRRLMAASAVLLYLGPLLAGLSGRGEVLIPIFALIFTLWLVVVGSPSWPRRPPGGDTAARLRMALTIMLVQLVRAGGLFALARVGGGLAEVAPPIPLGVTLASPMTAVLLAWGVRRSPRAERGDG